MVDTCAWESEKDLVPQDQIELLLSLLLEAEKRRWLASISPVNSAEHDQNLGSDGDGRQQLFSRDSGSDLLRHGCCIDEIQNRFLDFEPSHYCLKATTNKPTTDRPSSQMKVVSSEERFDPRGLSDSIISSPGTSSESSSYTSGSLLSEKDASFEVYKNALLCAKYPCLSEFQQLSPSTPYSPVLSPMMQRRRFSFSKPPHSARIKSYMPNLHIEIWKQFTLPAFSSAATSDAKIKDVPSSSDGPVSPDVFLPNLSDELQELVRNVFSLKKIKQKYFSETIIPRFVPLAKEPQLLLVRELENQKLVLKRNHHPYYSVQAFMNKDAYGEWVRLEEEKINSLIKSFWHNSYPSVTELPLSSEYHEQYVDLMKRLIRFESKHKEPHPVHGGVTPTAPLSSTACKLLKEFELRYGIGLLFCKICYLEYLVKYLENKLWYITYVTDCVEDVMDHVFKCPEIYVEKEFKMLLSILSDLLGKTKYSLTSIRKIFPENRPEDGVPKLVALFKLSLESAIQLQSQFRDVFSTRQMAMDFTSNLPKEPLEVLLASCIETEIEGRYERRKVIAGDDLGRNCSPPQLLLNVIMDIRQEVKDYEDYRIAFCSVFDITKLAAVKFYSLLMSDIVHLCESPRRRCSRDLVDPNMLCLAFRLSDLDEKWAKFIPFRDQKWRQQFQDYALEWLDAIGGYFEILVHQVIGHDVWRAVDVNITRSQLRTLRRKQERLIPRGPIGGKAASVPSLTPSLHSAFDTVVPSTSAPSKTKVSPGIAKSKKGKEPLHSRKSLLGSSPPLKSQGRTGMYNTSESSSDEELPNALPAARRKSPPKVNSIVVTAQVHNSAPSADSTAIFGNLIRPSRQEEIATNRTRVARGDDPRNKESSAFVPFEGNGESRNSKTSSDEKDNKEGPSKNQSVDGVLDPVSVRRLDRENKEEVKSLQTVLSNHVENTEERCVLQPTEVNAGTFHVRCGPSLNQSQDGAENKAESSVSIKHLEKDINELPVNEIHSEEEQEATPQDEYGIENHTSSKLDHPVERAENVEGQISESICSSDEPKQVNEVLPEGDLGYLGHDSGSDTSFENDSTDESDGDTVILKENSKEYGYADAPSTKSNSPSVDYQKAIQEDPNEGSSRPYPGTGDTCQTFTRKSTCGATEQDNRTVAGSHGSDESEKSIASAGPKGLQPRQSVPVSIPVSDSGAPRHKFVARLLDTPCGSVGSTVSDHSNYVTAGSVLSGNSIDTFCSARSSLTSRIKGNSGDHSDNNHCAGEDGCDGHSSKTESVNEESTKVLPVSSSFVDVICAVNRLTTFVCHLCKILCPHENSQRDEEETTVAEELRNETLEVKRRLCSKLIEVILSFITLYSDNVLAMETCGLPEELLAEILDEHVQRGLRLLREAGRLQGCRYNPLERRCCNRRDSRGRLIPPCEGMSRAEGNAGQFEPLTQQMGVRISSVVILGRVLPWLSEYVSTCVNNPDSLLSTHHLYASSAEGELLNSLSYCEHGPSLDGVPHGSEGRRGRSPLRACAPDDPSLHNGVEHLCRLETAQVRLATYRINNFFRQILRQLLDLNLPRYTIKKRLRPAMDFLSRELRRFHGVLYSDSFNKLLADLWSEVVENFSDEAHRLVRKRSSASEQSKLLQQAVAYMIEFFHAKGAGLSCDTLAAPIDAVVKHIQLYTHPTNDLISMYQSLYKQVRNLQRQFRLDEWTSSVSVSSHQASANAPADFVIQALRSELHTIRKCFSGTQLVDWVKIYVRDNGLDSLGVCIGDTETETGLELGQYLLEHGIIICVSPPPRFNKETPVERKRRPDGAVPNIPPAERGQVFIDDEGAVPDIRINNIAVQTMSSRSSPASSSRSASRSSTVNDSDSQGEADDEGEDDDGDFLGSASDILNSMNSAPSEREVTFYNHPQAFYKFISEEDTSRTEIKLTLGINDRFRLPAKLKQILCVLFTRKDSDRTARNFLRGLPMELLREALDGEEVGCYGWVCQAF